VRDKQYTPLYDGFGAPRNIPLAAHSGLWYERFFDQYESHECQVPTEGKRNWIESVESVESTSSDAKVLKSGSDRLATLCKSLNGAINLFVAPWHFVTGLGNPHPIENGFLWHPTLGTPYIPGATVKGLIRAWVEAWAEFSSEDERCATLHRWFGSENKDPSKCKAETQAGDFIFFDALPTKPVNLKADVMTPHMGGWYERGGSDPMNPEVTPADWHNPVPIPFLVADKPMFLFAIAPRRGEEHPELNQLMAMLEDALEWLGAGAKTAAGYGRLLGDSDEQEKIIKRIERNAMSLDERFRAEIKEIKPDDLARMFGKNFNKTRENRGNAWNDCVDLVWTLHGDKINSWKDLDRNTNKNKAYKKLCRERGQS